MDKTKKKPLQIYLRLDQVDALRALSRRKGESVAALVRRGVDRLLEEIPPEEDPLLEVVGLFDSGMGDLSEKHDQYIAQLIEEENRGGE